jgi:hypothetical protein
MIFKFLIYSLLVSSAAIYAASIPSENSAVGSSLKPTLLHPSQVGAIDSNQDSLGGDKALGQIIPKMSDDVTPGVTFPATTSLRDPSRLDYSDLNQSALLPQTSQGEEEENPGLMLDLEDDSKDITNLKLSEEGSSNPEGDEAEVKRKNQRQQDEAQAESTKSNPIEDQLKKLTQGDNAAKLAKKAGDALGVDVGGLMKGMF